MATARTRLQSARAQLGGGTLAFVVLSQAANVANYASTLVFSRVLEPTGFGELTSLLALALVLAVPLGAGQVVVAERIATAHAAGDQERVWFLARHALGHVATLGTIAGVLYLVATPVTLKVLDIREPGPVIALAPYLVLAFIQTVASGVLQGIERFAALGWLVFAAAAARLAFGIPWAAAGGGAGGAIGGQALGLLLVLVVVGARHRELWAPRGTSAAKLGLKRRLDTRGLAAGGAFIGFALLSNIVLVFGRWVLDRHESGNYAPLSTISKLVIFLPAAVAQLMVPRAVRARASSMEETAQILRQASLIAVAAAACVAVPAALAPRLVVRSMFGSQYNGAVRGVLPIVIAGSALAILFVVCTYSVAIRDRQWLWLLVGGVGLQITLIATLGSTPVNVAWIQATVVVLVLVGNELLFHSLRPSFAGITAKRRRRRGEVEAAGPPRQHTGATARGSTGDA
jgi:O-antigen/teichoic acid export membrane protein